MNLLATVLLCLYLPVPLIMLWLHCLQGLWKRWGRFSYVLHTVVYAGIVIAAASLGGEISRFAISVPILVRIAGAIVLAGALGTLIRSYRDIDQFTLIAGPQLTGSSTRRLITAGLYAELRHPRYAVVVAASLGNAMLTGYPVIMAACLVTWVLSALLIRIEDAELKRYFGKEFEDYAAAVPAHPSLGFILRRLKRGTSAGRTRARKEERRRTAS